MNLEQMRHLFRSISGRHDLVDDDAGKMADFYINEGSKFLDRLDETPKSWASRFEIISAGAWYVQFPYCRAVKEVWLVTADGRWQLEKKNLQDLLSEYLSALPTSWTNGTPLYYSPTITRYIPETLGVPTLATFAAYLDIISPMAGYGSNAVLFNVPVDKDTMVDVRGLFYSRPLVTLKDENYWSSQHPHLLALAALRQTHLNQRNETLLKSVDASIKEEMARVGMDLVEELVAEVDEIES